MAAINQLTLAPGAAAPDIVKGSIFFIGNATVLIRYAGFSILTDPTFIHMHEQVSIGYGLHATRLTNPAMEIEELPPLDLVLLSHFHGDHFDQVAEQKLDKSLPVVTTNEAAKELRERGFANTHPLKTWSSLTIAKGEVRLRISSMPGQHGPVVADLLLPEVMGSMLEFQSSSDDGPVQDIHNRRYPLDRRFRRNSAALSSYRPGVAAFGRHESAGDHGHDGRKQGVEAMQIVNPEVAIPIHYNDYDVFKSPLSDFQREVTEAGLEHRVHYLSHGEQYTFEVPAVQAFPAASQDPS